jgi:hypothetical protein
MRGRGKPYSAQYIRTSQPGHTPGSHSDEATSDHDAIGAAVIAHAAESRSDIEYRIRI